MKDPSDEEQGVGWFLFALGVLLMMFMTLNQKKFKDEKMLGAGLISVALIVVGILMVYWEEFPRFGHHGTSAPTA